MINTFDVKSFEEFQKFGKDSVDASMKAFGAGVEECTGDCG